MGSERGLHNRAFRVTLALCSQGKIGGGCAAFFKREAAKGATMGDSHYESFMGLGPKRIAHTEHWSNPDAETHISGIDYYAHPRLCRLKLREQ